jgi:hypothetical protein
MKSNSLLMVLTICNFTLLTMLLAQGRPAEAGKTEPTVLRGSALEIVDSQGRVRASISVPKADLKQLKPNGKPYPEVAILRMIDPNGKPNIKLGASVEGGFLGVGGAKDPTYIQIIADGDETFVRLKNRDQRQRLLKP